MKIITSINIYNFHVIISYLGDGLDVIKFEDLRSKRLKISAQYVEKILSRSTLTEITPLRHHIFGIENSKLKNLSLENEYSIIYEDISASQISFDFTSPSLIVLNEENLIQEIRPSFTKNLFIKDKFSTKSLQENAPLTVSNMRNNHGQILMSIRGFGITLIDRERKETIYRTEDAQDVLFMNSHNIIVVADYKGILFFKDRDRKPFKTIRLKDNDIPQEIVSFNQKLLIKGKNGLYLYDFSQEQISCIWNQKVGAFAVYFDMIFLSSQNKLYMISYSNSTVEHFKIRNEKLGVEAINYFHK